mgnify:CR=1 FL=1
MSKTLKDRVYKNFDDDFDSYESKKKLKKLKKKRKKELINIEICRENKFDKMYADSY